jgi:hypothetical protein
LDILTIITENPLATALIASAIYSLSKHLIQKCKLNRDKDNVFSFLLSSKQNDGFSFRSTEAISAGTKLTETRVEEVCQAHPNIKRNSRQKQSWCVIDE